MKKTAIIWLAFFLLFAVGCQKEQPTLLDIQYINETIYDSSYFPLEIGNEWIYDIMNDTLKVHIQVIDSAYFNAVKYFVVRRGNYQGKFNPIKYDTIYIRTDNGIKYYRYYEGKDKLSIDISQNFTDSISKKSYIVTITSDSNGHQTGIYSIPIGKFQECKQIESLETEPFVYIAAKGIGIISTYWFKGNTTLTYAKISGNEIGIK